MAKCEINIFLNHRRIIINSIKNRYDKKNKDITNLADALFKFYIITEVGNKLISNLDILNNEKDVKFRDALDYCFNAFQMVSDGLSSIFVG